LYCDGRLALLRVYGLRGEKLAAELVLVFEGDSGFARSGIILLPKRSARQEHFILSKNTILKTSPFVEELYNTFQDKH
jgi:hypothetical protein